MGTEPSAVVAELREEDLPFLFELWHTPEAMQYADELPTLRGWSKSDDLRTAWATYQERRAALGNQYTQLILRLADGGPIGESFFAPLPEGYTFGRWRKPDEILCLMGDIKLRPACWGRGLGSEGMQQVVAWLFDNTTCSLLMVPPHRKNPAAERVYEKAGFELYTGMRSWHNHKVMELTRGRYERLNAQPLVPPDP
ncbi:MAG: GNAT family N-acetyltransferase [Anaerolineae bacterium]